ncbi:MAG: DNA repair protein RecO [candidate division WOR-3 bacterium]
MSNILKTRGIVLRTFPFKESSLFCSIFTERFGKLKLIAKGARRPKSKLCGTLEPLTLSEIIFYKREAKDIYTLSDAVVIDDFSRIKISQSKFTVCEAICEFVDKTAVLEEPNRQLYEEILGFFKKISTTEDKIAGWGALLMLFRLLKFAGVEPHLNDCVRCHKPIFDKTILNFSVFAGGIVCEEHFDESVIKMDKEVIKTIINAKDNISPLEINPAVFPLLKNLLESYIFYHLNGTTLNTLRFIKY